jgi:hypothetical protein
VPRASAASLQASRVGHSLLMLCSGGAAVSEHTLGWHPGMVRDPWWADAGDGVVGPFDSAHPDFASHEGAGTERVDGLLKRRYEGSNVFLAR